MNEWLDEQNWEGARPVFWDPIGMAKINIMFGVQKTMLGKVTGRAAYQTGRQRQPYDTLLFLRELHPFDAI